MNEAPEKVKPAKKKRKGLMILLVVIAALCALAAVVFFGVYRDVYMYLTAELGEGAPDAGCFIKSGAAASYAEEPDVSLTEEGEYILTVKTDSYSRMVLLIVRDTTAPEAESADKVLTIDDKSLKPEDALKNIHDASDYTAEWVKEPRYGTAGAYDCSVLLRDSHGNERTVLTTVKVVGVKELVTYEAGTERPTLADFMVVDRENAEILTDLNGIDWTKLGDNTVEISFDGKTYTSTLRVVDTTAPVVDAVPAAVTVNGEISAGSFVLGSVDATEVNYELTAKPDTSKTGAVKCELTATDAAGNTTKLSVKLLVCDEIAVFEASDELLTEKELLKALDGKYSSYKLQTEPFVLNSPGAHGAVLENVSGETVAVGVVVKDTVAPAATGINCDCGKGYPREAIKFLDNIVDASSVKASFVSEPDWSAEGEQAVEIVLTDRFGNSSTIAAKAVIAPDKTAPVIYGARDFTAYAGAKPDYTAQVLAEDNADPAPELTVDDSKVDTTKAGTYELTYTAKDHEGNESSVTVKCTLIEKTVSDEKLNAELDKVAKEIFEDGMSKEEKLHAIFDYVYAMKPAAGSSDRSDMMAAAYKGLTEKQGDSFTLYCVSYYLLQKADCRVMSVMSQGSSQHFWCLVDIGSGWYQFDPCDQAPGHYKCFMKTSDELKKVSSQYWSYDTKLYPVTESRPYILENR